MDQAELAVVHSADPAEIALHFLTQKNFRAGNTDGLAAKGVDLGHDLRVDHAGESLLDNLDRLIVGDAHAIDELRLQARLGHGLRDRLAAAMYNHRVDAHGFEEHDIAQEGIYLHGVFHRAAADLDQKRAAAEALHVGQGFKEYGGFGDLSVEGIHRDE